MELVILSELLVFRKTQRYGTYPFEQRLYTWQGWRNTFRDDVVSSTLNHQSR